MYVFQILCGLDFQEYQVFNYHVRIVFAYQNTVIVYSQASLLFSLQTRLAQFV